MLALKSTSMELTLANRYMAQKANIAVMTRPSASAKTSARLAITTVSAAKLKVHCSRPGAPENPNSGSPADSAHSTPTRVQPNHLPSAYCMRVNGSARKLSTMRSLRSRTVLATMARPRISTTPRRTMTAYVTTVARS